jgi:hypothetical protein
MARICGFEGKANHPPLVRSFFFGLSIRFNPLHPGAERTKPEISNEHDVLSPHEIGSTVPMDDGGGSFGGSPPTQEFWDWSTGREADYPCQGRFGRRCKRLRSLSDIACRPASRVTKIYVKRSQPSCLFLVSMYVVTTNLGSRETSVKQGKMQ